MIIRVDPGSSVPVFQQIVDEVKSAVARGACAPNDPIPSVRQMAAQALVNPNTVARAYRELERDGIVYTRKGLGVFVSEAAAKLSRNGRREDLGERFAELVAAARRAGLSAKDVQSLLEQAIRAEYRDGGGRAGGSR